MYRNLAVVLLMASLGCEGTEGYGQRQTAINDPPQADQAWSGTTSLATPQPAGFQGSPPRHPPTHTFLERLPLRLGRGDDISIIRVRVESLVARSARLPLQAWPEDNDVVVTDVSATVLDHVCGTSTNDSIVFSYVGGKFPDGRFMRTSLMRKDLMVTSEVIVGLARIDGSYYLVGGTGDLLQPDDQGFGTTISGQRISRAQVLEACQ